jgi:hypothetical protein
VHRPYPLLEITAARGVYGLHSHCVCCNIFQQEGHTRWYVGVFCSVAESAMEDIAGVPPIPHPVPYSLKCRALLRPVLFVDTRISVFLKPYRYCY